MKGTTHSFSAARGLSTGNNTPRANAGRLPSNPNPNTSPQNSPNQCRCHRRHNLGRRTRVRGSRTSKRGRDCFAIGYHAPIGDTAHNESAMKCRRELFVSSMLVEDDSYSESFPPAESNLRPTPPFQNPHNTVQNSLGESYSRSLALFTTTNWQAILPFFNIEACCFRNPFIARLCELLLSFLREN